MKSMRLQLKNKTKVVVNEHKDDLASALDAGETIEKEIELTVDHDKRERAQQMR